jgi:hypothetical protein
MYPNYAYTLLWSVQPFLLLFFTLFLPLPIIQQFSIPMVISSTFTDVMFYNIVDTLSFSSFLSSHKFPA